MLYRLKTVLIGPIVACDWFPYGIMPMASTLVFVLYEFCMCQILMGNTGL